MYQRNKVSFFFFGSLKNTPFWPVFGLPRAPLVGKFRRFSAFRCKNRKSDPVFQHYFVEKLTYCTMYQHFTYFHQLYFIVNQRFKCFCCDLFRKCGIYIIIIYTIKLNKDHATDTTKQSRTRLASLTGSNSSPSGTAALSTETKMRGTNSKTAVVR